MCILHDRSLQYIRFITLSAVITSLVDCCITLCLRVITTVDCYITGCLLIGCISPGSAIQARNNFEVNGVLLLICILHTMSFNTSECVFEYLWYKITGAWSTKWPPLSAISSVTLDLVELDTQFWYHFHLKLTLTRLTYLFYDLMSY